MANKPPVLIGADAYPVFIMHEQLNLYGFLHESYKQGLDAVWEHCCMEYAMFLLSKYDVAGKSEYDCIVNYVKSLNKITLLS